MFNNKYFKLFFLFIFATLAFSGLRQPAFARDGRDDRRFDRRHFSLHHPYPFYGRSTIALSSPFFSIAIGGSRYYYGDGIFYRRYTDRYFVVPPPIGAMITILPDGCYPVVVGGMTYYTGSGIYYRPVSSGYYEVVPEPASVYGQVTIASQTVYNNRMLTSSEKFGIADIITLSKAGINDDVLIDKIIKTGSVFTLGVEEVEAMRREGVSSRVINFMISNR